MGDVADAMMDEAMEWAYASVVCPDCGHRFIPDEWGCYNCELNREEGPMSKTYVPEDGPKTPFGFFRNNYKEKDTHPDFVGDFSLTDTLIRQIIALRKSGKVASLGVAGWRKETTNGDPFVSCSIQVDTYKTARRYECDESEIKAIMADGGGAPAQQKQRAASPPPADDPFLSSPPVAKQPPAGSPDPFADTAPPLSQPDDDLPF